MRSAHSSSPLRQVGDEERRARLAVRHGLHPEHLFADPLSVARAMVALHSTDPSTVHLSIAARTRRVDVDQIERALYIERALVKAMAMRRTIFAFPAATLPAVFGAATPRVAAPLMRQIIKDAEAAGLSHDGTQWLTDAVSAVEDLLADGTPRSSREIRESLPQLAGRVRRSIGKPYASVNSIAPLVLTLMGLQGTIVRGPNGGHWSVPRPQWVATGAWLGGPIEPVPPATGYAELVSQWLWAFGPGTEDDLVWWLGSTKQSVRQALADVAAVPVGLANDQIGWLRPDDLDPVTPVGDWAALLPTLDVATMGWRGRDFYLDASDAPYCFDTAGNGVASIWLNGRIVGVWVQERDGAVAPILRHRIGPVGLELINAEVVRLTEWLDGTVITNVYDKALRARKKLP